MVKITLSKIYLVNSKHELLKKTAVRLFYDILKDEKVWYFWYNRRMLK